jgi:D-Tyr-tRNAtyr deacylase
MPPTQHRDSAVEKFVDCRKEKGAGRSRCNGEFGAMIDVELVNDGPETLMLER